MAKTIKTVAVGDNCAEKTQLLISYATGKYPQEYVPTVSTEYLLAAHGEGEHTYMMYVRVQSYCAT